MPRKKFDYSLIPPAPNLHFEHEIWQTGVKYIAGIDEAGRGALAGPVVAGAVILRQDPDLVSKLDGVRDSKELTAKKREDLASLVSKIALDCKVGFASAAEIDEIGIIPATRLAAIRALAKLKPAPQHLLIDYISIPGADLPETSLIKGDARSLSIACASILAKVERDHNMENAHPQFPNYEFARHKGYGTAKHREAIKKHGPCEIHRKSFAPINEKT